MLEEVPEGIVQYIPLKEDIGSLMVRKHGWIEKMMYASVL